MKKKLLVMGLLIFSTIVMAFPISFLISNEEASLSLTATPMRVEIGYPMSSIFFKGKLNMEIVANESTSLVLARASVDLIKLETGFLTVGEMSKFGHLKGRINNGKILEIGRNFFTTGVDFSLFGTIFRLEYLRFYSSFNYNPSKNILFLAPPNYSGEAPNSLSLYVRYSLRSYKEFRFSLFVLMNTSFSDSLVFGTSTVEIGASISTTTENLQRVFQTPR